MFGDKSSKSVKSKIAKAAGRAVLRGATAEMRAVAASAKALQNVAKTAAEAHKATQAVPKGAAAAAAKTPESRLFGQAARNAVAPATRATNLSGSAVGMYGHLLLTPFGGGKNTLPSDGVAPCDLWEDPTSEDIALLERCKDPLRDAMKAGPIGFGVAELQTLRTFTQAQDTWKAHLSSPTDWSARYAQHAQ